MKCQFALSIGLFMAALGCEELPAQLQKPDASDASTRGYDAATVADGGDRNRDGAQPHGAGSGGDAAQHDRGGSGSEPLVDAGIDDVGQTPMDASNGEPVAGSPAPVAGSGGSSSEPMDAGSGPVAGNGGSGSGGSGSEPVHAGSGGEPAAGSGGSGGSGGSSPEPMDAGSDAQQMLSDASSDEDSGPVIDDEDAGNCPTDYTMATHIKMNVTWPKKTMTVLGVTVTVVDAGSGVAHIWTKSSFSGDGTAADVVSRFCGSTLPESTGFGEIQLIEIPNGAWDASSMPTFTGTAMKSSTRWSVSPGTALLGLTMSDDPNVAWPARTNIMGADHDSDTFLGLGAVPKADGGYSRIPVDTSRSKRADRVDLAIRNVMTLSASARGCPDTYTGTASVTKLDKHVIGCHIYAGSECTSTQVKYVDDNSVVYAVTSATFRATHVADNASCDDVRNAVP